MVHIGHQNIATSVTAVVPQQQEPRVEARTGSGESNPSSRELKLEAMLKEAVRLLSLLDFRHLKVMNSDLKELLKLTAGTFEYPFGIFTGDLMNGIPHGKGVMHYNSGNVTKGCLFNDTWEGFTVRQSSFGKIEEGWTHRGKWHGLYSVKDQNRKIETGCMVFGKWQGVSLTYLPKHGGRQYSTWEDGEQTGQYLWVSGHKPEIRLGNYFKGVCQGEKRVYSLDRRELWEQGECKLRALQDHEKGDLTDENEDEIISFSSLSSSLIVLE